MLRLVAAGFVLFFGAVTAAQLPLSTRSTLGPLLGQQFHIDDHVQLSVNYDASDAVCAALIAPPGYRLGAPVAEINMDSKVVDQVLEVILPGILTDKQGASLMTLISRNSFLQRQFQGARLDRHFLATSSREETVVATLQATSPCHTSTTAILQAHYGQPQVEQFSAVGNITIGVTYGANQIPRKIDFDPSKGVGTGSGSPTMFNAATVERWISRLISPEEQSGTATHHVSWSGPRRSETDTYNNFSIRRSYQDGALIQASITWK